MKPLVGIAYTTFNRVGLWRYGFRKLIDTTLKEKKFDYVLSISDDGSRPEELAELEKMVRELKDYCIVQFESGKLANIARNRNRALWHVQSCDYIFSFEDDIYPFNSEWITGYVECLKKYPHLMYLPKCIWPNQTPYATVDRYQVVGNSNCGGIMMAFKRELLEDVGGFHSDFGIYGYEHAELTERANMALRNPANLYLSIREAETAHWFISADEHNCCAFDWGLTPEQWKAMDAGSIGQRLTPDEIQESIRMNSRIWERSRAISNMGNLYREIKWK
jgi:hypothetical protein